MYRNNNGLIEWSLDHDQFENRLPEILRKWNVNNIRFYSQQDEDKYLIQYMLKDKITDGVFLEVGGCDGVLYSNTKTLEDYFGFSGIIIEPQIQYYQQLVKNRPNCENYNCAITMSESSYVTFMGDNPEGGVMDTINTQISKFPHWTPYNVKTAKMKDILTKSKFNHIDFMFIDVEGGELDLLKSIDFSFDIFCIIIEAHPEDKFRNQNNLISDILTSKGFHFKERQRGNNVWINHSSSRRHLFNV